MSHPPARYPFPGLSRSRLPMVRLVTSDGREEKEPVGPQTTMHDFKKVPVIQIAYMLKHSQRSNPVEWTLDIAIITQADFNR